MDNRVWDYTTIDTFQTCRKRYYFWGVKHIVPKVTASALEFGGAIHLALDAYYTEGLSKALKIFGESYKEREGENVRTLANGIKLLEHYARVYKHEPFKPLGKPEAGFVFPLGDILYGGRIDLPVEWGEEMWIVEHKTTTWLTKDYFKQFTLDKQLTGYIISAEEYMNRPCMGCVVNVLEPWKELKRPTAKSKKPEDHFVRMPLTRTKFLRERFKLNIHRIVRDIKWCEDNNEFYEAEKKDVCFKYNYECPYKDLCLYGEDERIIEKDFRVQIWEPYKNVEVKGEKK